MFSRISSSLFCRFYEFRHFFPFCRFSKFRRFYEFRRRFPFLSFNNELCRFYEFRRLTIYVVFTNSVVLSLSFLTNFVISWSFSSFCRRTSLPNPNRARRERGSGIVTRLVSFREGIENLNDHLDRDGQSHGLHFPLNEAISECGNRVFTTERGEIMVNSVMDSVNSFGHEGRGRVRVRPSRVGSRTLISEKKRENLRLESSRYRRNRINFKSEPKLYLDTK